MLFDMDKFSIFLTKNFEKFPFKFKKNLRAEFPKVTRIFLSLVNVILSKIEILSNSSVSLLYIRKGLSWSSINNFENSVYAFLSIFIAVFIAFPSKVYVLSVSFNPAISNSNSFL